MGASRSNSVILTVCAAAPALLATAAHAQCRYSVTPIYHQCGETVSPTLPQAMNDRGDATGYVHYCLVGSDRPFVWTEEAGMQLLPLPGGVSSGVARDIANDGRVVGEMNIPGPSPARAFVYDRGEWTMLDPVDPDGAGLSVANAIGEDGTIAGYRTIDAEGTPYNAFTWHPETGFTDLGLFGGELSLATAIRNGRVVGWASIAGQGDIGFLVDDGVASVLGPVPGGTTSKPSDVNSWGTVCGSGRIPFKGTLFGVSRAFTWDATGFHLHPPLPGDELCGVLAISDKSLLVGLSAQEDGLFQRATVWKDGQPIDLNDLIETELSVLIAQARDINAAGQILAVGRLGGATVSFRLDPIDPSPADLDGDCDTDHADLQKLFNDWGHRDSVADLNVDGVVDALDFLLLLAHWSA